MSDHRLQQARLAFVPGVLGGYFAGIGVGLLIMARFWVLGLLLLAVGIAFIVFTLWARDHR